MSDNKNRRFADAGTPNVRLNDTEHRTLRAILAGSNPLSRRQALTQQGNRLVATLTNELTGHSQEIPTSQVINEVGTEPVADIFFELQVDSNNNGLTDIDALASYRAQPEAKGFAFYRLGDAVTSRSIHAALLEAYRIAVWV